MTADATLAAEFHKVLEREPDIRPPVNVNAPILPDAENPEAVKAVMDWAARQGYAKGGYPHARSLMLDTLETVLILDAARKKKLAIAVAWVQLVGCNIEKLLQDQDLRF